MDVCTLLISFFRDDPKAEGLNMACADGDVSRWGWGLAPSQDLDGPVGGSYSESSLSRGY